MTCKSHLKSYRLRVCLCPKSTELVCTILIHPYPVAEKSLRDGVVVFVLHNVGILTGIGLLYLLAYAGGDFLTDVVSDEA